MKQDNQHLDFLISQYVDGCLEGAGKKSVEQQLLNDPEARQLYAEHHEVQELLDDWGNRIPLIDWNEFDQKLAGRLEQQTIDIARRSRWQRWLKPVAAAAALFIAASLGYGWNAWWSPRPAPVAGGAGPIAQSGPRIDVKIEGMAQQTQPWQRYVTVDEPAANGVLAGGVKAEPGRTDRVAVAAPENSAASDGIRDALRLGLGTLSEDAKESGGTVGAHNGVAVEIHTGDPAPIYP